jgi:hypothetical protein
MVRLRNICINTLHKGDNDDDNNYYNNGNVIMSTFVIGTLTNKLLLITVAKSKTRRAEQKNRIGERKNEYAYKSLVRKPDGRRPQNTHTRIRAKRRGKNTVVMSFIICIRHQITRLSGQSKDNEMKGASTTHEDSCL